MIKKIGIVGGKRGKETIPYFSNKKDAKIVAICDFNPEVLDEVAQYCQETEQNIKLYPDFEDFLQEPLDGVILANFANEHAPFAIKCLNKGIAVLSDVLPVASLKEAVELVETVERTGGVYHYGENYCFLDGVLEMKRQYELGHIGELEYAEGEYFHNCETLWHFLTGGNPDHWRNTKHTFYYCTHSIGPICYITGLRPVSVTGFESKYNAKMRRLGILSPPFGVEMITLSNGALFRSAHGNIQKNSIWYCLYGSMGCMETARNCDEENKNYVYASLDTDPNTLASNMTNIFLKKQI